MDPGHAGINQDLGIFVARNDGTGDRSWPGKRVADLRRVPSPRRTPPVRPDQHQLAALRTYTVTLEWKTKPAAGEL